MNIIEESFADLYPEKPFPYEAKIKYSRKFKPYNANVQVRGNSMVFHLSREWKDVDREIKMGLLQELMIKIMKRHNLYPKSRTTKYTDLYNIFIKKVHMTAPKTKFDAVLFGSFDRMNEKYFFGTLEAPNLMFGSYSLTKLGLYEYGSDTITISSSLKEAPIEILDYIMYHEMLHKKLKFDHKRGKAHHHTPEFKEKEKAYEIKDIEVQLSSFLRKKRYGKRIRHEEPFSFVERLKSWF